MICLKAQLNSYFVSYLVNSRSYHSPSTRQPLFDLPKWIVLKITNFNVSLFLLIQNNWMWMHNLIAIRCILSMNASALEEETWSLFIKYLMVTPHCICDDDVSVNGKGIQLANPLGVCMIPITWTVMKHLVVLNCNKRSMTAHK